MRSPFSFSKSPASAELSSFAAVLAAKKRGREPSGANDHDAHEMLTFHSLQVCSFLGCRKVDGEGLKSGIRIRDRAWKASPVTSLLAGTRDPQGSPRPCRSRKLELPSRRPQLSVAHCRKCVRRASCGVARRRLESPASAVSFAFARQARELGTYALDHRLPLTSLLLAEQSHCRIPWTIVALEHPTPVRHVG